MDHDLTVTSTSDDAPPLTQIEIDQRVFGLYDEIATAAWTAQSSWRICGRDRQRPSPCAGAAAP